MTGELVALLDGKEIGRVHNDARGRLTFVYDDEWRKAPDAYPLSISAPLAAREHGPSAVQAFLWGLLPDNELVLSRWATKFQVSARNAFALLSHVGEDCAGAVQFVTPERHKKRQGGQGRMARRIGCRKAPSDVARRSCRLAVAA
jgi:serine/threonine-protein kinase HipA